MSERTNKPTAKRLRQAREEGNVPQTPSIPHLLAAAGVFELVVATSGLWLPQAGQILGSFMERLGQTHAAGKLAAKDLLIPFGGVALATSVFVLVVASVLALIGNVAQTGFVVATKSFFRMEKMDPVAHLSQMFDAQHIGELLMNLVKVVAVLGCMGVGLAMSIDSLIHMADGTLDQAALVTLEIMRRCERIALLVLVICVAIDWAWRRHTFMKQVMMTREETEREQKDDHGDKHVRAQRNEFRRDMLGGQLTENTRKADAVVTNPTHFAVALLYDPEKFPLPVVVARGTDASAALMRRIAREQGIPIIRSVQLARMLYSVGREWRPVPRVALKAVAAVYRVVAQIRAGERIAADVVELDDDGNTGRNQDAR